MSIPLNWLVLFFFIMLAVIFFVVYEINSKFKWKSRSFECEEEVQNLRIQLSNSSSLKGKFKEIANGIKEILTPRQFQIFVLTIEGLSSKEIGEILNLSASTVDSHIKEIIRHLGVKKRSQLAAVFWKKLTDEIGINSLTDL